jgi:hypothetical protein
VLIQFFSNTVYRPRRDDFAGMGKEVGEVTADKGQYQ